MEQLKRCSHCGKWKAVTDFRKNRSKRDGLDSWCKECAAWKDATWRRTSKEAWEERHAKRQTYSYEEKEGLCLEMVKAGKKNQEIRDALGYANNSSIYEILRKNGIDGRWWYKERDKRIIELRENKESMSDIAKQLGMTMSAVASACRRLGVGGEIAPRKYVKPEQPRSYDKTKTIEKYKQLLDGSGFEYLGGYTDGDGVVQVRCRTCGREQDMNCQRIRKKSMSCAMCQADERSAKQEADRVDRQNRKEEKAQEAARKQEEREKAREAILAIPRYCPECGAEFHTTKNMKYCSAECRKRAWNRQHSIRRGKSRTKLSLQILYARDGGKCYLCGCDCDFDDYELKDGFFNVGPKYPTVEHVIPLSKGGPDDWDNVKLACHRCNTKKSTRSQIVIEQHGQLAFDIAPVPVRV